MLKHLPGAGPDAKAGAPAIRHFLDLDEIDAATLRRIIDAAHAMKKAGKRTPQDSGPRASKTTSSS